MTSKVHKCKSTSVSLFHYTDAILVNYLVEEKCERNQPRQHISIPACEKITTQVILIALLQVNFTIKGDLIFAAVCFYAGFGFC